MLEENNLTTMENQLITNFIDQLLELGVSTDRLIEIFEVLDDVGKLLRQDTIN